MKRILQLPSSIERKNGRMSVIMNVYRKVDRSKIQFDFAATDFGGDNYKNEIKKLGGRVYLLNKNENSIKKIEKLIKKLLVQNNYQFIHYHAISKWGIGLSIAHKLGVKVIVESHATELSDNLIKSIRNRLFSLNIITDSDYRIAISKEAGRKLFLFQNFDVIPNMINYDSFKFNEKSRKNIRSKFGIKNEECLIGCVARITKQKNQKFALKILAHLPSKYKIMFVGEDDKTNKYGINSLQKNINKYNLNDRVIFAGEVRNVNEYYSAFDIFWLPSLYEGLPTVALEAYVNGLPCILSNKITREVGISTYVHYLPISKKGLNYWAHLTTRVVRNKNSLNDIKNSEFNSKNVMRKWEKLYGI